MILAFLGAFILICKLLFWKRATNNIINPAVWLFVSWLLISGLYFFSGIQYFYRIEIMTYLYLAFAGILFYSFYLLGLCIKLNRGGIKIDLEDNYSNHKRKYLYISLFGLAFYIFDIFRHNSFTLGMRNLNLNVSIIGTVGSFMANASLFLWLYELAYAMNKNVKLKLSAWLPLGIYLFPNIVVGGRQSFVIAFISSFCIYQFSQRDAKKKNRKYRYKNKIVYSFLFLLISFTIYNRVIIENRSANINMNRHYQVVLRNEVSAETEEILQKTGVFQDAFLQGIQYYSQEINGFAVVFQEYDCMPLWGMYELQYISRRLPASLELDFNLAREEVERISFQQGTRATLYRTALKDFILDFGRSGALVFTALLGFGLGRSFKKFKRQPSIYKVIIQAMLCAAAFFSVEYSPLYETRWAFAFYWSLIIPLVETNVFHKIKCHFQRK